jgi:hypothetical protein
MATVAFDLTTILHAMQKMAQGMGHEAEWSPLIPDQDYIIKLLEERWIDLGEIGDLVALCSEHYAKLNAFLTEHGFEPTVSAFDPSEGLGVVSILDKTVNWASGPGIKVDIFTEDGPKPGFELPARDVTVFTTGGPGHLLRIATKEADTLWIYVPWKGNSSHNDLSGLDLFILASEIMSGLGLYPEAGAFAGAHVPMVDFSVQPDLSFLLGMIVSNHMRSLAVLEAGQQFKLRMNEEGARVKVATNMSAFETCIREPERFIVDTPFFLWFTHEGFEDLPLAVARVDFDSMKKPEGSLSEL